MLAHFARGGGRPPRRDAEWRGSVSYSRRTTKPALKFTAAAPLSKGEKEGGVVGGGGGRVWHVFRSRLLDFVSVERKGHQRSEEKGRKGRVGRLVDQVSLLSVNEPLHRVFMFYALSSAANRRGARPTKRN